ncbi:MAG: O-methyltransferase [Planctomyces sp.]
MHPHTLSDSQFDDLLADIHSHGTSHDAVTTDRTRQMLNITPSTGRFLELLVQEQRPRRILEIGTSNAYSTLWLLRAAAPANIHLDSLDHSPEKHQLARRNLQLAGLEHAVQLHTTDALQFLSHTPPNSYDFVFLDADRSRYTLWWPELRKVVKLGVIVCDNAVSHAAEFQPLLTLIDAEPALQRAILTIGKGQLLIRENPAATPAGTPLVQLQTSRIRR